MKEQDTPLMYKAVPSWYVAVEKIVSQLSENNQKINWFLIISKKVVWEPG